MKNSQPANTSHDHLFNKVPEVTIYFWIIKVLCTTVGETASDFLNVNMGFGLTGTSIFMGVLLLFALFLQFKANRYEPALYWLTVVLISIFGTLVTDILTDIVAFPLEASTILFSIALALTFILWYRSEGTLSIHSIFTRKREAFYWLAILFTFALGTAAGDLMAERLGLGYLVSGIIVCVCILGTTIIWYLGLDAVLAFWIAYILTRPLGASFGDYLSQPSTNGGLGLGAPATSLIFLLAILSVVIFLSLTRRDFIAASPTITAPEQKRSGGIRQVVAVVMVVVLAAGAGYFWRSSQLQAQAVASSSPAAPLGDLSAFRRIAQDILEQVRSGDMTNAHLRADDLEHAWDTAEAQLRLKNPEKWSTVDDAIDDVLRNIRAIRKDAAARIASLQVLIAVIDGLSHG